MVAEATKVGANLKIGRPLQVQLEVALVVIELFALFFIDNLQLIE